MTRIKLKMSKKIYVNEDELAYLRDQKNRKEGYIDALEFVIDKFIGGRKWIQ